ncbi:MAG: hypothetical protein ABI744_08080 [Chloroflexota bacterium]
MMSRLLVALALTVVSAVGCSLGPTVPASPTPIPTPSKAPASPSPNPFSAGHYDDGTMAFDYPADWNAERPWYPSSVSDLKADLSTETLRPPCVVSGSATLCRPAVEGLSPGGILITWWRWGLHRGNPGPDPTDGQLIHVGGRSARLHDSGAEGHCLNIDADTSLRLEIPDPTLDGSWTVMDACLRSPVEDSRAKLDALLASVTWSAPQPTSTLDLNGGVMLQVYDDTGLVTDGAMGSAASQGNQPDVSVDGNVLEVRWVGGVCQKGPILGLVQNAGKLLLLLEPDAGPPFGPTTGPVACPALALFNVVDLTLSQPFSQEDVSLEVW